MKEEPSTDWRIQDVISLRFDGENTNGTAVHELRAEHVAQTLLGLTELTEDFEKAGVFHPEGPIKSEILIRPAKEGSFIIEAMRFITENPETAKEIAYTVVGIPTVSQLIQWSVKATSDQLVDASPLDDGSYKVKWRNDSVDIIPAKAFMELNKKTVRRRKQLRKIMAPLTDPRITELNVTPAKDNPDVKRDEHYTLTKADYIRVNPEDEIEESSNIITHEGTLAVADLEGGGAWSVRVGDTRKKVEIKDSVFLEQVRHGEKVNNENLYTMMIQEDRVKKNGKTTSTKWTILHIKRKEAHGDDPNPNGDNPHNDTEKQSDLSPSADDNQ
ncbi:hypothetical protein [Corynebacterium sp.]|uniref:hypothetical protein n=1 Tax=Corynebacterium sp. TaxID=1720 RepID=UPI0026DB98DF|nr:hypothetical protein [Corynebacterium sp.]MDO5076401.1 hypothetical protein [Corynebacterium sp.]